MPAGTSVFNMTELRIKPSIGIPSIPSEPLDPQGLDKAIRESEAYREMRQFMLDAQSALKTSEENFQAARTLFTNVRNVIINDL